MASIISTFHIDWKIIIAQAVNFAVVFVVLYIFALKPLNKLMSERSDKIKKGVEDAKENATMLKQTKTEHEAILAQARIEATKIYQEGKKETEAERTKMAEDAKAEVASILASGKKALEAEKVKMVEEAHKDIAELAMLATEKLIKSKQDLDTI